MKYTVKRGDNLWTLAKRAGVPLSDLLAQVPESVRRDPRKLQPGMTLNIGPESIMFNNPPRQQTRQLPADARHFMKSGSVNQQDPYATTRGRVGAVLGAPMAAVGAGAAAPFVGEGAANLALGGVEGMQGAGDAVRAGANMASRGVDAGLEVAGRGLGGLGGMVSRAWNKLPPVRGVREINEDAARWNRQAQQWDDMDSAYAGNKLAVDPRFAQQARPTSLQNLPSSGSFTANPTRWLQNESRGAQMPAEKLNRLMQENPDMTLEDLHALAQRQRDMYNPFAR